MLFSTPPSGWSERAATHTPSTLPRLRAGVAFRGEGWGRIRLCAENSCRIPMALPAIPLKRRTGHPSRRQRILGRHCNSHDRGTSRARHAYSTSCPCTEDASTIFGRFSASANTVDAAARAAVRRNSSAYSEIPFPSEPLAF